MYDLSSEISQLQEAASNLDNKIKSAGGAEKIALQYYSYAKSFAETMSDIQSGKNNAPEETVTQLRNSASDLLRMIESL